MGAIRTFWRSRRLTMAVLFALALSVKLLLPQGFMLGHGPGTRYLTVQLCYDGISRETTRIAIPADGDPADRQTAPDQHCPFASLAFGMLGPDSPPLVAKPAIPAAERASLPDGPSWRGQSPNLPPPSRGPPASA
jgi:hypothetical protein